MKKFLAVLLCAITLSALSSCGQEKEPETELIVFGAASLTETLNEIGRTYMEEHENVRIRFNFDSSGTLKTQIKEGAVCDIFLSAGQKQMDQLEELSMVASATRTDLLENKIALCVATNSTCGIRTYDELADALRNGSVKLTIGNSDVPVGQYTQKILAYYGLDEDALAKAGCLSYGSNAKEVTTQVSEGTVDCGIIYVTDAFSAGLEVADTATAQMCGQVIYPAAVMADASQSAAAADFIAYLRSPEAAAVFASVGFTPLSD